MTVLIRGRAKVSFHVICFVFCFFLSERVASGSVLKHTSLAPTSVLSSCGTTSRVCKVVPPSTPPESHILIIAPISPGDTLMHCLAAKVKALMS